MRRLLALLLLALIPIIGFAQGVGGGSVSGLTYITPITPGDCAKWQQVGVLADAGAACGSGSAGIGPGSVGQLCIFTSTTNCTGTPGTATNQLLYWNGTAWVPLTAPAADGDVLTRSSGALVWSLGTTYPGLPSNSTVASTDLIAGYPSGGPLGTYTANQVATFVATNSVAGSGTSITPSCAYEDNFGAMTATGGTFTVNAPTGCTAAEGQKLVLHLKFTNSQTYSWNAAFVGGTTALPTTSTGTSKGDWVAFRYDSINSKWDYVATATGF